jgi:hypothetical protein
MYQAVLQWGRVLVAAMGCGMVDALARRQRAVGASMTMD